jgi:hypothetical protein
MEIHSFKGRFQQEIKKTIWQMSPKAQIMV